MIKKCNTVALFTAPHTIELENAPMPTIEDDYALVEYLYCGICGGDYSVYCGYRQKYPISLGHEFVGRVLSVGKSVHDLVPNQVVVSDFNYRCNKCSYCVSKRSHLCDRNDIGLFSNRGFAKYASIHASYLIPIQSPDYLPRACLIEPLSCAIHAASCAKIHDGMRILLCGGGSIGMLFCFLLKRVFSNISLTLAEESEEKVDKLYKRFEINKYDSKVQNEYDLVIDCSNSVEGLTFSLNNVPRGGNICIMSHLYGHETSFVYESLCKRELSCIFPLRNGERNNVLTASYLINNLWTKEDDVLIITYDNIQNAFKEKKTSPFCKQVVHSASLCT